MTRFKKSLIDLGDFYTPIKEAKRIIQKRWENKQLQRTVEKRFSNDIPNEVSDVPSGVIWKHIGTPDREFARFLDLTTQVGVKPLCFEYTEDKFVARNFTKFELANLPFTTGLNKNGKTMTKREKIINFDHAEGRRLCDLKTLWGESLVDFHHWFLCALFPIMKGRVVDVYEWTKRHGSTARERYQSVMTLALTHFILFDDYDIFAGEDTFTLDVVLPSFKKVEAEFDLRPLVVRISKPNQYMIDPYWWCYSKETKDIMERHKQEYVWI